MIKGFCIAKPHAVNYDKRRNRCRVLYICLRLKSKKKNFAFCIRQRETVRKQRGSIIKWALE